MERGETVIAPRPQKISSTRHTLAYNGYINGGKESADGGAVVSDDNPRLKEWIAKFENPNESAERRIIAQLSARDMIGWLFGSLQLNLFTMSDSGEDSLPFS